MKVQETAIVNHNKAVNFEFVVNLDVTCNYSAAETSYAYSYYQ